MDLLPPLASHQSPSRDFSCALWPSKCFTTPADFSLQNANLIFSLFALNLSMTFYFLKERVRLLCLIYKECLTFSQPVFTAPISAPCHPAPIMGPQQTHISLRHLTEFLHPSSLHFFYLHPSLNLLPVELRLTF